MTSFDAIQNWQLLRGSHEFPGPNGGTCINEAAVIAAGLPYREIKSVDDLPACFSPVLSMYALGINDNLNDMDRQRLMPYVVMLAGSKGHPEEEQKRTDLILSRTTHVILPFILEQSGVQRYLIDALRETTALDEISIILNRIGESSVLRSYIRKDGSSYNPILAKQLKHLERSVRYLSVSLSMVECLHPWYHSATVAHSCARFFLGRHNLVSHAFSILAEAFEIGPRGGVDLNLAVGRLSVARQAHVHTVDPR